MPSRVGLALATLILLASSQARADSPSITVSPPPGAYTTTQGFDLLLVINPARLGVVGASITFDSLDVTDLVVGCGRLGVSASGAVTLRCPGLSGAVLGVGIHVFHVTLSLSDGSTTQGGAVWEILGATGP